MALRELINKNVGVVISITVAMALAVGIWAVRQSQTQSHMPVFPDKTFFSTDDGATWFPDGASNIPPYDRDGKQAVRAMVYSCDGGRHKWVQYLEKYNEPARQQMASLATGASLPANAPGPMAGLMLKKPGGGEWILESSTQGQQMMKPQCPDGSPGPAVLVTP